MLTDVHFAPELVKNLVSMACIAKLGCLICIDANSCHVLDGCGCAILQGATKGNMLVLPLDLLPLE